MTILQRYLQNPWDPLSGSISAVVRHRDIERRIGRHRCQTHGVEGLDEHHAARHAHQGKKCVARRAGHDAVGVWGWHTGEGELIDTRRDLVEGCKSLVAIEESSNTIAGRC